MAVRVYADADALAAFRPGGDTIASEDAESYLTTASQVVDELLKAYVYDVDADGMPTDTDVADAMKRATCIIAISAKASGVMDPGGPSKWESVAIGSVSLSNLQGASVSDPITVLGIPVPPAALFALSSVGCTYVDSQPLPWWAW